MNVLVGVLRSIYMQELFKLTHHTQSDLKGTRPHIPFLRDGSSLHLDLDYRTPHSNLLVDCVFNILLRSDLVQVQGSHKVAPLMNGNSF
jgi:hypothetical protein